MSIGTLQLFGKDEQPVLVLFTRRPIRGLFHQDRPLVQLRSQLRITSAILLRILDLPRTEMILPSLNREFVKGVLNEMTDALPSIVLERSHRCPVPVCLSGLSPLEI